MNNSEFVSSDEHIEVEVEEDDFEDGILSDEEIEELGYSSLSDNDHSDFWNDFDEVNPDDVPY
jgi:hypothetical protein